jgi:glycosyltransferase involved in cell wall biosynthesis
VYRALRYLCDQGLSVQHTLIGDGDDRKRILSFIKELGLDHITQCLGTQPHRVVLEHYRRADLFALGCEIAPNGDRDGIPNVLLESMAMGVPVVVTRVSAIPELIENEKTGLLIPPGEPEKMAQAMARLLTERNLRNQVISAARERVMREFNSKTLIGDLAVLFRKQAIGIPGMEFEKNEAENPKVRMSGHQIGSQGTEAISSVNSLNPEAKTLH